MKVAFSCALVACVLLCGLIVLQQSYINHIEHLLDEAVNSSVSLPAAVSCGPVT